MPSGVTWRRYRFHNRDWLDFPAARSRSCRHNAQRGDQFRSRPNPRRKGSITDSACNRSFPSSSRVHENNGHESSRRDVFPVPGPPVITRSFSRKASWGGSAIPRSKEAFPAFAVGVEVLNLRLRRKLDSRVQLHQPYR